MNTKVLHIYNPEHDICLAHDNAFYTAPKAAILMRREYGHVPAFWAKDGDIVLTDDPDNARKKLAQCNRHHAAVTFITLRDLRLLSENELPARIEPWGWDRNIMHTLMRANPLLKTLMPSEGTLKDIREMSSRAFAAREILPRLVSENSEYIGWAKPLYDIEQVVSFANSNSSDTANNGEHAWEHNGVVLKSPWSCSGRGVRIITKTMTDSEYGWAVRVIREQGYIMGEPYYNKVCDFGMEFMIGNDGKVRYLGLSVFSTSGSAYIGNIIDTEAKKEDIMGCYVSTQKLCHLRESIMNVTGALLSGRYSGPFGIDMMVVKNRNSTDDEPLFDKKSYNTQNEKYLIHPCVEMNLRRTMGHAALI